MQYFSPQLHEFNYRNLGNKSRHFYMARERLNFRDNRTMAESGQVATAALRQRRRMAGPSVQFTN